MNLTEHLATSEPETQLICVLLKAAIEGISRL